MNVRGNILKNVVDLNVNGIHDVGTSLISLTGHHSYHEWDILIP